MNKEKKKEFERTDIDIICTTIVKFLIICCIPWVLISKLDRELDYNSDEGFECWNFYWSFPATHLSWLFFTVLFGLPLWGLIGAPVVLPVCMVIGVTDVSLSMVILAVVITAVIWIGLYKIVQRYRSLREVREVRREIYGEEGVENDA